MSPSDSSEGRQLDISPLDLGFPPKFADGWRETQTDIILDAVDCQTRVLGQSVPTGGGKSPSYVAAATLSGDRTIILTSTKGLQTQVLDDFSGVGMVDIRGKANYSCNLGAEMTCEDGADARCPDYRSGRCPYSTAYGRAKESKFVITNYTYWILINLFGEGLGRFTRMVCDEAHSAHDEVCGALTIELTNRDVLAILRVQWPVAGISMLQWQEWAGEMLPMAEARRDSLKMEVAGLGPGNAPKETIRRLRTWRALCRKLLGIMMAKGEWIPAPYEDGYRFDPLWAADYAEEVLFIHIPKINLVSATLTEKTLRLLGINDNYTFIEYPSTFPPENSPLIWLPTVRMSHSSDEYDLSKMLITLDDLIQYRLDRKIIVHTVSYDRRDLVLGNSRFRDIMITHDRRDTNKQVALFKRSIPPAVFVSPSITTGYDFPYDECECQIIIKIPFPVRKGSPIMEARSKEDPDYPKYITAQSLTQMCGRGNRAPDDRCENIVTDNMIRFLMKYNGEYTGFFPLWFKRLYKVQRGDTLPVPPPKLQRRITSNA